MLKKLKKGNVEPKIKNVNIFFKRKLLIHIGNRVDPGCFKLSELIRFNLTRFSIQPVEMTRFKLTHFLTGTVQPVESPKSNRVSNIMFNPQILKLLLFFVYDPYNFFITKTICRYKIPLLCTRTRLVIMNIYSLFKKTIARKCHAVTSSYRSSCVKHHPSSFVVWFMVTKIFLTTVIKRSA